MADAIQSLTSVHQILHLANHRNKNQHRLSKWWKNFSQLRRNVAKLIAELEKKHAAETALPMNTKQAAASPGAVELRVAFMEEFLMPRCYLAFSALVADNQYATLGLMLIGTLARVQSVIRPLGKEVEIDEKFDLVRHGRSHSPSALDLGEMVSRVEFEELASGRSKDQKPEEEPEEDVKSQIKLKKKRMVQSEGSPNGSMGLESTPTKPPKKKRKKKGDAIDDLFGRLL